MKVEFRDVSYRIGEKEILSQLNLQVEPGETLVLLGRSGSGKTTALKMVNRLTMPSQGEVLVDGKATTSWDLVKLRRRIGYVIQEVGLFPHFTVAQNVGLVPRLERASPDAIDARVSELLSMVDLPPQQFASRFPPRTIGRPAAASGRCTRAGGRSAHSVIRRAVRSARSGHAARNPTAISRHNQAPRQDRYLCDARRAGGDADRQSHPRCSITASSRA